MKSSRDDLQKLVEAYLKEANDTILSKIIHQLQPFIGKIARRISELSGVDVDDLKQEMSIVVIKRLANYDITKGKFITYLINTCKGDPTDTLQTMVCKRRGGDGKSKYAATISLNEPLRDGDDELTLAETLLGSISIEGKISYGLLRVIRDYLTIDSQKVFDILYEDPEISEKHLRETLEFSPEKIKKLKNEIKRVCIMKGVVYV
jgi:hypothetical protein